MVRLFGMCRCEGASCFGFGPLGRQSRSITLSKKDNDQLKLMIVVPAVKLKPTNLQAGLSSWRILGELNLRREVQIMSIC